MPFCFQQIETLANDTKGQYLNTRWRKERKGRLQAAIIQNAIELAKQLRAHENSGHVLLPEHLTRDINWQKKCMYNFTNFDYKEAVRWGIDHEKEGISAYERLTGLRVVATGLWIFPSGFVCCSPDGLIFTKSSSTRPSGILEIKCPHKLRNVRSFTTASWTHKFSYLKTATELDPNHRFYDLIQAELYATRTNWCDFLIWCPAKTFLLRVSRDQNWITRNIPLVDWFFSKYLFPLTRLCDAPKYHYGLKNDRDVDYKNILLSKKQSKRRSVGNFSSSTVNLKKFCSIERK